MKFTSRKFILAAVGDLVGIATMAFGQSAVTTIVGAALVIVINAVYCIIEGSIDAKTVGQMADAAQDIAKELGAPDGAVDAIGKLGDVVEVIVDNGGDDSVDESK